METSALHRMLAEPSLAYKTIAATILAIILYKLIAKPKRSDLFPVSATIELALASYILRGDGLGRRIFSAVRRKGGSLFGVTSGYQVFVNLPGVDRVLTQSAHKFSSEPVQYTLHVRVFGATDSPQFRDKYTRSCKDLFSPIDRLFLNDAATTAALEGANVHQQAASLVTFSTNVKDKSRWELCADVQVKSPGVVEANLESLTRDFGACIAISILYGKDFLDGSPRLLEDFWRFDNDLFVLLVLGIPEWAPFKMMREGLAARSRVIHDLEALFRRIDQFQQGDGSGEIDAPDCSTVPFDRNKVYAREGWSFAERAVGEFAILWGQNANTQPVLFWLLTFAYSTPGLVDRIREEIAPYIHLSETDPKEITSMDLRGLFRNCQLLKATIFETYRFTVESSSTRFITQPLSVSDGQFNHQLKPGTFVSVPHSVSNHDPSVYPDPDKFIPERFLETDSQSGKPIARYGRQRPWGVGASMCKGRTFAEKEIISLGAVIISLWDIAPASGKWEIPSMVPGTGTKRPPKDIRVAISRRT